MVTWRHPLASADERALLVRALVAAALFLAAARVCAAPPALIELKVGKQTYQGKIYAHDDRAFWLLEQDGRLRFLEADEVKGFRQISPKFSGWNASILKDQMRREFPRPYDVASTRHYVACAQGEAKARLFAETLEEIFRTFQMYFTVRGFKVPEPDFPMVALVFADKEDFARYARKENVPVGSGLRGYYLMTSNRIAFFEDRGDSLTLTPPWRAVPQLPWGGSTNPFESHFFANELPLTKATAWPAIEASLKDTLIHEATHQAAFNTGLHSRIGQNPKWMVEGLATVFEAPGVRNSGANLGVKTRINPERLVWFGNFSKDRRKPQSLEAFISSDELFQENALDAYSQAWALTFFLFETRPRNYAEYLRTVATRDPLAGYTPQARVADFQRTISKDLKLLDAEFLRFMGGIK